MGALDPIIRFSLSRRPDRNLSGASSRPWRKALMFGGIALGCVLVVAWAMLLVVWLWRLLAWIAA